MSRLRLTSIAIVLFYTWCVLLGNLSHSLAHHLEDSKHDHSLTCLNTALVEGSEDEGVRGRSTTTFGSVECSLKLALHALSASAVFFQQSFDIGVLDFNESSKLSRGNDVILARQFLSVISARGPPA